MRTHCIDHKSYDAISIINRRKRSRKEYEVGKDGKKSHWNWEKEYEFDVKEFDFVSDENLNDLILGLDFNF